MESNCKLEYTYRTEKCKEVGTFTSSFAILSIEREITNVINFDTIINDFAALKSRKVI